MSVAVWLLELQVSVIQYLQHFSHNSALVCFIWIEVVTSEKVVLVILNDG